jgi:hypothetical protein
VRLVEAVLGELLHQVEDLRRGARIHPAFGGAGLELAALLRHFLGLLLAHRAAQQVGAAQRIAGQHLGDLHHLFLVHDHAVGRRQHRLQRGVRIAEFLDPVLAVDHCLSIPLPSGPGRNSAASAMMSSKVSGLARLQFAHAARFELEHRGTVSPRANSSYVALSSSGSDMMSSGARRGARGAR